MPAEGTPGRRWLAPVVYGLLGLELAVAERSTPGAARDSTTRSVICRDVCGSRRPMGHRVMAVGTSRTWLVMSEASAESR